MFKLSKLHFFSKNCNNIGFHSSIIIEVPDKILNTKQIMKKKKQKSSVHDFFKKEYKRLKWRIDNLLTNVSDMEAEDVIQDVFLNIYSSADITQPVENLTGYIYRAAKNKVIDLHRKKKAEVSLDQNINAYSPLSLKEIIADTHVNIEKQYEEKQMHDLLFKAIDQLKSIEKAVVIATEIEGQSFKSLSKEWNIPIGTLLSHKSRAIKQIKSKLFHSLKLKEV